MSDESYAHMSVPMAQVAAGFAVGSRIAGYRLEQQIGLGGMAVVFRATDERLDRPVALKILAPGLAADEAFRQRFVRESRAAAAVDDPHIIPIFEAGEASGALFIAMRYVRGGDVRTLVRREGPMSPDRACAIISPIASALDAAHDAGLIHRDVKPANMLVDVRPDRPDHVYLSDFGLSKGELSSSGLTGTGQFLGTVDYCAPEQIEGRPVDGRADQYGLACSAFELLTGAPPFVRDQATAMIWAHMSQPPPLLTARRPDLPVAADQVLAKGLAKAPTDRYRSCGEFADALRHALGLAPYRPRPGAVVTDHTPTRTASSADRGPTPQQFPPAARVPQSQSLTTGPAGPRADPAISVPPPAAAKGITRREESTGEGAADETPQFKRPWTRDWTTWLLILGAVGFITGVALTSAAAPGIVGALVGLSLFVAIPVGLIAKLVRRLRRRSRRRAGSVPRTPGR
jgi:serine/threonine protein kinase